MEGVTSSSSSSPPPTFTFTTPLLMDTKGSCFLCLRILKVGELVSSKVVTSIEPFKLLTGYVQMDVRKVLERSMREEGNLQGPLVGVPLCSHCCWLAREFLERHQQFEQARAQVETSVRKIFGVMDSSERNEEVVRQYHRRTVTNSPSELVAIITTNNLRTELLEKCSIWTGQSFSGGGGVSQFVEASQSQNPHPYVEETLSQQSQDRLGSEDPDPLDTGEAGEGDGDYFPDHVDETDEEGGSEDEEWLPKIEEDNCTSPEDSFEGGGDPFPEVEVELDEYQAIEPKIKIVTQEVLNADQISFTTLPDGRRRCNLCNHVVAANFQRYHVFQHTGEKPYSCKYCEKTFRHPAHVNQHTYLHHRETFFMEHKDDRTTTKQFATLVGELFDSVPIRRHPDSRFHCVLCKSCRLTIKGDVHSHMIRLHMDEILPRLLSIQRNLLGEGGEPSHRLSWSPSKTSSPSKTNPKRRRRRQIIDSDDDEPPSTAVEQVEKCPATIDKSVDPDDSTPSGSVQKHREFGVQHNFVLRVKAEVKNMAAAFGVNLSLYSDLRFTAAEWTCESCNAKVPVGRGRYKLEEHFLTHESPLQQLNYLCKFCDAKFSQKQYFALHIIMNHGGTTICANCDVCNKELAPYLLVPHLKTEHSDSEDNQQLFHCSRCSLAFVKFENLVKHSVHHTATEVRCVLCSDEPLVVLPAKQLLKHLYETHELKHLLLKCKKPNCSATCFDERSLSKHKHTIGKTYSCHLCPATFSSYLFRKNHLGLEHGIRNFSCQLCEQTFRTKSEAVRHRSVAHGLGQPYGPKPKRLKCDLCTQRFSTEHGLKYHLEVIHGKGKLIHFERYSFLYHRNEQGKFACPTCTSVVTFTRADQASKHHVAEHGYPGYSCDLCPPGEGQLYASTCGLRSHQRYSHKVYKRKAPKTFECSKCGKSFSYKESYKNHQKTHLEDRDHVCEVCGFSTKTGSLLRAHMHKHATVKNHACPHCPMQFVRKGVLDSHLRTHTGEKPYQCQVCGAAFTQNTPLTRHMRKFHEEEKRDGGDGDKKEETVEDLLVGMS